MEKPWFEPFVWTDYRLAILFTVLLPLILLIWAFTQKNEAIQRLLGIYWRVASLLAITLYLMIAGMPIGFLSGLLARILIPISLWFWVDLNEEIDDQPAGGLKLVFTSWRWAVTLYHTLGFIALLPFIKCAFSQPTFKTGYCDVWLNAPRLFKEYFHANTSERFLGFLAFTGLIVYVIYLSYFILVKLGKQGRSATQW